MLLGWCAERFVEPGHQIAVGKEIHAQKRHQAGEAPAETGGELQITHEHHRDQCCPNLSLDRIRRRADNGLDLQVLLERRKEQLDLPAILLDGGDGGRAEAVMIGKKHQGVSRVLADRLDPAQQMRTLVLGPDAGQADGLILDDVPVLRHRVFLDHLEQGVVLHTSAEIDTGIRPVGEQPVGVVSSIINDESVGRKGHVMGSLDVSHLAIGDDADTRQLAVMGEDEMQFDGPLGATELRPVIQRQAQVDHGRIQADQLVLEAEFLLAHGLGGNGFEQSVEHLLEQLPGTMAIGVGQRRARRCFDAQVGQLALAARQPAFDLSKGVGAAQLAEQPAHKLAPTRQSLAAVLGSRLLDDAFEVGARDELEDLTDQAA